MRGFFKRLLTKRGTLGESTLHESKAIFWFDWRVISDGGNSFYGRYVYQHLLPHFAPQQMFGAVSPAYYHFWDGDFLPQGSVDIPCDGPEAQRCLARAKECGFGACYLVAVFGSGPVPFSTVDQRLSSENVLGYLGMTPCRSMNFEAFWRFANGMALVHAFKILEVRLEKVSFTCVTNDELAAMGFEIA